MAKTYEQFYVDLGNREAHTGYKTNTGNGMLGRYQLSKFALIDTKYIDKDTKRWTGKNNIYSTEDFLNSSKVQDQAIREYHQVQWNYMKNDAKKYHGKVINGTKWHIPA